MATSRPAILSDVFEELDIVRLRSIVYDDANVFPSGTIGTVVLRYPQREAYEVEVCTPVAAVLTLRGTDLEPTDRAASAVGILSSWPS